MSETSQPGSNNTLKIVLLSLVGVFLLCCGGGAFLAWGGVQEYQKLGKEIAAEGDRDVQAICANWDSKVLLDRSGPEVTNTPASEIAGFFNVWKNEYGAYQSGKGQMLRFNTHSGTGGQITQAQYQCDAHFDKADGLVTVSYKRENGGPWKIIEFKVKRN